MHFTDDRKHDLIIFVLYNKLKAVDGIFDKATRDIVLNDPTFKILSPIKPHENKLFRRRYRKVSIV